MPGAYYSDPASIVFSKLESAIIASKMGPGALARLSGELERLLPSPTEQEIDSAFREVTSRLSLGTELDSTSGKRVALRMIVTIANTLSQPVVRESGVMRLPQTIRGLFDPTSKQ
ncbi:MAG: hypothetical protein K0R38_42 [Polyangiaceae bacterium]|nr:hypothetical protein [Polyangiaceae bacterium]